MSEEFKLTPPGDTCPECGSRMRSVIFVDGIDPLTGRRVGKQVVTEHVPGSSLCKAVQRRKGRCE